VEVWDLEGLGAACNALTEQRAGDLVVIDHALFARHPSRLADLVLVYRLPSMVALRAPTWTRCYQGGPGTSLRNGR